jgi:hypothetical protein
MFALLKKNYILKKRRIVVSIVEILFPVLFALLFSITYIAMPTPPDIPFAPFVPVVAPPSWDASVCGFVSESVKECAIGVVKGDVVSSLKVDLESVMPVREYDSVEELSARMTYSYNYSSDFVLGLYGGDNGEPLVVIGEEENALSALILGLVMKRFKGPNVTGGIFKLFYNNKM